MFLLFLQQLFLMITNIAVLMKASASSLTNSSYTTGPSRANILLYLYRLRAGRRRTAPPAALAPPAAGLFAYMMTP